MALDKPRLYQIKVTLRGSQPPIWRRLTLSSKTSLGELHRIIQAAMGWEDCHLHLFQTDTGVLYGPPEDKDDSLPMKDERSATLGRVLRKPKKTLSYEYDFGDGWLHDIQLEKSLPLIGETPPPTCTQAARACPPEDVGGLGGYLNMLDILQDPSHPEYREITTWLGDAHFDPDLADLDDINTRLLYRDEPYQDDSILGDLMDDIRQTLASQGVESEEEVEAALQQIMEQQASSPMSDFHGLDPDRMHALLYDTFDAGWLTWASSLEADASPVIRMLRTLLDAMGPRGLKTTAKGNLPLAVVQGMMESLDPPQQETVLGLARNRVRSEEHILPVHVTRVLAEMTGIVDIRGTRLVLTPAWRKRLAASGWDPVFPALFRTMMTEFNWGYLDRMGDAYNLQTTGPFLLWLLHRYGDQWHPATFYEDAHLQAFPMLVDEIEPTPYSTPEDELRLMLRWRALTLFHWFGLTEQRPLPAPPSKPYPIPVEIKATPVMGKLVRWG